MTPKLGQNPLPLWVAAMFPKALEEAGANGYHLAAAPPASMQIPYDNALRKAGHDPGRFQRSGLHIGSRKRSFLISASDRVLRP